jgi:predicted permease
LTVVARLNPGGPIGSVTGELRAIAQRLDAEFPVRSIPVGDRPTTTLPRDWMARRLTDTPDSDARMAALILGLVALVLVVACTNLANLVMARGAARQQEIAVRRALGAQRWRLVRELLVEGGIIAVAGGLLSLLVVRALLNLATFDLPLPGRMLTIEPELNPSALAVASITALLSLIVFSLEPAWQLTRATVLPDLAGGDHAVGAVRSTRQRVFIRWQIAASVTFFLIAAVLARAVVTLARNDSGVDLDRLAIATAYLPRQSWDEARARAAMQAIADAVRQEPSIERAAISSGMPFGMNSSSWATATTPDKPFTNSSHFESTLVLASTPEFFRTLGIPILRGRAFDERDDAAAPRVMVISEGTARTFFGTTDAIGRQLMTKMWGREPIETYTVIGVARDTDAGRFGSRGGETTFVPQAQHYEPLFAIAARSAGDVNAAAKLIQKAARRAAPDVAIGTAGPASIVLAGQYFAARVAAALATALGLLTLVVSMIGLYGVQGHLVARRRREIGVRMAIGATREQIGRMVVKDGVRPVVEGIVLGTVLAIVARLLLRTFINANILVVDPLAFVLVPLPLISAAFVACYLPARRASRVDPNEALRDL